MEGELVVAEWKQLNSITKLRHRKDAIEHSTKREGKDGREGESAVANEDVGEFADVEAAASATRFRSSESTGMRKFHRKLNADLQCRCANQCASANQKTKTMIIRNNS